MFVNIFTPSWKTPFSPASFSCFSFFLRMLPKRGKTWMRRIKPATKRFKNNHQIVRKNEFMHWKCLLRFFSCLKIDIIFPILFLHRDSRRTYCNEDAQPSVGFGWDTGRQFLAHFNRDSSSHTEADGFRFEWGEKLRSFKVKQQNCSAAKRFLLWKMEKYLRYLIWQIIRKIYIYKQRCLPSRAIY